MKVVREQTGHSIRRLAQAAQAAVGTVGHWFNPPVASPSVRKRPVSGDEKLHEQIRDLCARARREKYGHRRIRAELRREYCRRVNRKTVARVMRELNLAQPKLRFKPKRPPHVEKMRPEGPNQAWQVDMTSFPLADFTPLFLVVVLDTYTRKIVGWTLDRRCRASEWIAAVRLALEAQGLTTKEACSGLTLRSDNGSQPCSKKFVEFLGTTGVRGQYTGYGAPDDNAFVERVMRTIKEEEIWPNVYESWSEAHAAIDGFVQWYNNQRIHSALGYQTPNEVEQNWLTLKVA